MKSATRNAFVTAVCVTLLTSATLGAQLSGTLTGPILGYLFDADAGKLRPLRGVLGSTTVGAPIELGFAPSQVLALDATHVIASTDSSPELLCLNLESVPPSTIVLSGAPGNPTYGVSSLQNTAAAFYYAGIREVRIVTGLPQVPAVAHRINFSQPGRLTHIAVSNDGTLLLYSIDEGETESVYSWTANSDRDQLLMAVGSIGGLAVTGNGAAIVADRAANEVYAIWDLGGAAIRQFLVGARDGVANPAGVAVSAENRIFIANADEDTVIALDSNGRFVNTLDCKCNLSGMFAFRDSVFRLTDHINRTIFLLDASSAEGRILFVPPPKN